MSVSCESRGSFLVNAEWADGSSKKTKKKYVASALWDVPRIVGDAGRSIDCVCVVFDVFSSKNHLIKIAEPAIFIFQHWTNINVVCSCSFSVGRCRFWWLVSLLRFLSSSALAVCNFSLNCPCVVYSFACVTCASHNADIDGNQFWILCIRHRMMASVFRRRRRI